MSNNWMDELTMFDGEYVSNGFKVIFKNVPLYGDNTLEIIVRVHERNGEYDSPVLLTHVEHYASNFSVFEAIIDACINAGIEFNARYKGERIPDVRVIFVSFM